MDLKFMDYIEFETITAKIKGDHMNDQMLLISTFGWMTAKFSPNNMNLQKTIPVFHSALHQLSLRGEEAALPPSDETSQVPEVSQMSLPLLPGSW